MSENVEGLVVRTSQQGWLEQLARAYRDHANISLIDDANVGLDPSRDTLLTMGRRAQFGFRDWVAVVITLGVAATGAFLVVMAILDPEPFSKIGFALGAGVVMTMGGGFSAIRILTNVRPPTVRLGRNGIVEISWE